MFSRLAFRNETVCDPDCSDGDSETLIADVYSRLALEPEMFSGFTEIEAKKAEPAINTIDIKLRMRILNFMFCFLNRWILLLIASVLIYTAVRYCRA